MGEFEPASKYCQPSSAEAPEDRETVRLPTVRAHSERIAGERPAAHPLANAHNATPAITPVLRKLRRAFYAQPRIFALESVFTLSRSRAMKSFVAMLIMSASETRISNPRDALTT